MGHEPLPNSICSLNAHTALAIHARTQSIWDSQSWNIFLWTWGHKSSIWPELGLGQTHLKHAVIGIKKAQNQPMSRKSTLFHVSTCLALAGSPRGCQWVWGAPKSIKLNLSQKWWIFREFERHKSFYSHYPTSMVVCRPITPQIDRAWPWQGTLCALAGLILKSP